MNKLFLALALLSFVLAPFDFVLQDLWEGLLPVAWGALFLFLAFRDRITAGDQPNTFVAVFCHLVEDRPFPLHHIFIVIGSVRTCLASCPVD